MQKVEAAPGHPIPGHHPSRQAPGQVLVQVQVQVHAKTEVAPLDQDWLMLMEWAGLVSFSWLHLSQSTIPNSPSFE